MKKGFILLRPACLNLQDDNAVNYLAFEVMKMTDQKAQRPESSTQRPYRVSEPSGRRMKGVAPNVLPRKFLGVTTLMLRIAELMVSRLATYSGFIRG
jgi:hypothetical protein